MRNRSSHYCGAWNDSYLAWSRIIHKPWLFALNDHHTVHKDGLKYSDPFHGHIYNPEEITYELHYRKSSHTFTHMLILCIVICCYIIFFSDGSFNNYVDKMRWVVECQRRANLLCPRSYWMTPDHNQMSTNNNLFEVYEI